VSRGRGFESALALRVGEDYEMDERSRPSDRPGPPASALRQLGLVVHPTRRIEGVLDEIAAWASAHGLTVVQVPVRGQTRRVADPVEADACDLLLAIGGDGTTLIALQAGAPKARPVLGVACGSIGALTSVSADRLTWALDQIATGRWTPVAVPGLDVAWGEGHGGVAINDVVIIRDGPGQVMVSIVVDAVLYARLAGDGLVVATALGSSAYSMAAGGPLLAPGAEGMAVTPLEAHGGSCPPLVAGTDSQLTLTIEPGYGGVRYELDGRRTDVEGRVLTVRHRANYATLVTLAEGEPRLSGLRRRGLLLDSPRLLVRDDRAASEVERGP
jgi:NAD+ kinase